MKDMIRDNLKMIEENLPRFNSHALKFIDPKELRKTISVWRWYVSHDYFHEKHKKPEGVCSNPPIGWLHAQLVGQTVPLARDIGKCIEPVASSSLMTEHAARRIYNRLNMIWHYVSREAALRDQQAHRDAEDKKAKDRARAAKAREDRKPDKRAEAQKLVETKGTTLTRQHLAAKNRQRKEEALARKNAQEEARKRGKAAKERMIQEMKERRK